MRKSRLPDRETTEDLLLLLYDLRRQKEALAKREEKLSKEILLRTAEGEVFTIDTEDGLKEARHIVGRTHVMPTDMNMVYKKLKKDFFKVVTLSVSKLRELFGEKIIEQLSEGAKEVHYIKFFTAEVDK